jgi:hypothetical protein
MPRGEISGMAVSSRRLRWTGPAAAGIIAMLASVLGPAEAAGPVASACPTTPAGYCKTEVNWTAKPGVAGYPLSTGGPSGPGGPVMDAGADVHAVSVSFDDHYLHFEAKIPQATNVPPPGMSTREYIWRFTYGGQAFVVDFFDYYPGEGGVAWPDWLGVTVKGADSFSSTQCSTCVGSIDSETGTVAFFVDPEAWDTFIGSEVTNGTLTTAPPPLERGLVLSHLSMEIWTDSPSAAQAAALSPAPQETFEEVVAPAPKGLTYSL